MNKNKWIVWMLRALFWCVSILIITGIVGPFFQYSIKESLETAIVLELKAASEGNSYPWLLDHKKNQPSETKNPKLIISNSSEKFEEIVINQIDNNTLILEMLFNEMTGNILKTRELTTVTGVEFTGFIGKTYFDLSDSNEVPEKLVEQFEMQTNEKWNFYGEGIVFNRSDVVIVLKKGEDYKGHLMVADGNQEEVFTGYFEVTEGTSEVVAMFNLKTTNEGRRKLEEHHLLNQFPALYQVESTFYEAYYFAGNFSELEIKLPYKYDAISNVMKHKIIYDLESNEKIYWRWYYPKISEVLSKSGDRIFTALKNKMNTNSFFIEDKQIYISENEKTKTPFFIKGVNLGAALPGKNFTEFPMDKAIYMEWFEQMYDLNINTIRVYTLLPPVFYEALYEFNQKQESPLYLLQEIWPEEHPVDSDYLNQKYNVTYKKEIEYAVHAIHGNINIPKRDYRAYGIYRYDVSDYLIGYLVGREMEPEEVKETDRLNVGYQFKGKYFYSESEASATESWLASSCDYTLEIEELNYDDSPLIAIVSWPTLDSIKHDSEWNDLGDKSIQYNDSEVVDINNIGIVDERVSGFFGAYHIYPNYPDFMNNETQYAEYEDEQGSFRYGGYLNEFISQHDKYPAIVAEYGISTSMYTAHFSPDGYHHGGLSETEQAEGIIRMTNAIRKEGYSGAVIFEWMDEWAKKTWTTEPYMIPYSGNPYWHNAMDPEQNYGLLAFKSFGPDLIPIDIKPKLSSKIKAINSGQNNAYLYLDFEFKGDVIEPFDMAISTNSEVLKNDCWEFLLRYDEAPMLLVNPGYNWVKGRYQADEFSFETYEELMQITNKENTAKDGHYTESQSNNLSSLSVGSLKIPQNHIEVKGNRMTIRLPYGLLGISDPSTMNILSDEREFIPIQHDLIRTKEIDSIKVKLMLDTDDEVTFELSLQTWDTPEYTGRLKDSFDILSDYFKNIE